MFYFSKAIRFIVLLLILTFSILNFSNAQFRLTDWKTHTSMFETRETSIDSKGRIWAATSGGVYNYDINTKKFTPFRNTEGLLNMDVSAIKCDTERKLIFIGCFDGTLEILTEDYEWHHELGIKDHNFTDASINDFLIIGNDLFIAGNFGIAVYDLDELVFVETITKIAGFRQNVPVHKLILHNNKMWAATQEGVAVIDLDSPNFSPAYWKSYSVAEGLPDGNYIGIAAHETIYVISETELFKIEGDEFKSVKTGKYYDLKATGESLYLVGYTNFEAVGKYVLRMDHPGPLKSITFGPSNNEDLIVTSHKRTSYFRDIILTGINVAFDDADIAMIADRAGLKHVAYADYEYFNILGIYASFQVNVYGYDENMTESTN